MSLSRYRELLDNSVIMKDLHKIRNVTEFAHSRPHLLTEYPDLLQSLAEEYLRVDGVPKKVKQKRMLDRVVALPKKRLLADIMGGVRAMV
jgi:electron transfer flavoprotein-quinone oxidoreductase